MTSPSSKHKPYTTGARPSTTAAKANVHMSGGGWIRTITATDYAWAGNNNVNATPETLVAFRGSSALQGWYAYTYWVTKTPSEATPVAISVHVHFQEAVDVTGSPRITITNTKAGGGSATTKVATYVSGTGGHRLLFTTAVPSANQFKEDDLLYIGIDALSLNGGTIKDAGTATNSIITNAAVDTGYNGSLNRGGNYTTAGVAIADGPRLIVEA